MFSTRSCCKEECKAGLVHFSMTARELRKGSSSGCDWLNCRRKELSPAVITRNRERSGARVGGVSEVRAHLRQQHLSSTLRQRPATDSSCFVPAFLFNLHRISITSVCYCLMSSACAYMSLIFLQPRHRRHTLPGRSVNPCLGRRASISPRGASLLLARFLRQSRCTHALFPCPITSM